jgi:hypothetical protein
MNKYRSTKPREIKNIIIAEIIKRFQYEEGFTNIILKQTQKLKISKYS